MALHEAPRPEADLLVFAFKSFAPHVVKHAKDPDKRSGTVERRVNQLTITLAAIFSPPSLPKSATITPQLLDSFAVDAMFPIAGSAEKDH
jgi:hypothetical protein